MQSLCPVGFQWAALTLEQGAYTCACAYCETLLCAIYNVYWMIRKCVYKRLRRHANFQIHFACSKVKEAKQLCNLARHDNRHLRSRADRRDCIVAKTCQLCRYVFRHHAHVDLRRAQLHDLIGFLHTPGTKTAGTVTVHS